MSSFAQGLSGLRADQKAIEVTSNNIANSNSVGFKSSRVQFGDVYTSLFFGGSANQVGKGTQILDVDQQFTQGVLTPTGNPLDLAVSGDGFFKVRDASGNETFTRAGQFQFDNQGFVINSEGKKVQMFPLDPLSGNAINATQDLQILDDILPPQATEAASVRFNLDAREPAAVNTTFDPTDPTSYNTSSTLVVYDELGREHSLNIYWSRVNENADPAFPLGNQWKLTALLDGVEVGLRNPDGTTDPDGKVSLLYTPQGNLRTPEAATFTVDLTNWNAANGRFSETDSFTVNMNQSTQFGAGFVIQDLAQDGYQAAQFTRFDISDSGRVSLQYSNGESKEVGQVALFKFRNVDGLIPVGENSWISSPDSGPELPSLSQDNLFGLIKQGSLENSNVDLTESLVELIVFQRSYQANSQSIKTQDALLQTATNLRNG